MLIQGMTQVAVLVLTAYRKINISPTAALPPNKLNDSSTSIASWPCLRINTLLILRHVLVQIFWLCSHIVAQESK